MLQQKNIQIVLWIAILVLQNFIFQVPVMSSSKLVSSSGNFKDYHVSEAIMCEWYFSRPDLFETVLFYRFESIDLNIKRFINNLNKIKSNKKIYTLKFQENIHKESQKLRMGIEILSSIERRKPLSDYSILISRLGIMFDNLKKLMCYSNDTKENMKIRNEIEKLQNEFYHLVFDPIAYTLKYIAR